MKHFSSLSKLLALLAAGAAFALATHAADMPVSGDKMGTMDMAKSGSTITVTGEVLDMACYLDHGAHGDGHAACAEKCITSGLPVGLKSADGTVYLLIGEHKPANAELAPYAAKTVTVKGKFVNRDGINLLENIEIVK
jgi:type 1 fimbria pilin